MANSNAIAIVNSGGARQFREYETAELQKLEKRKRREFAHLAPQYEWNCQLATFGRIERVRRSIARLARAIEGTALDLCCGTGGVTLALAREFEHVIGVDLSPDMLNLALARVRREGPGNITLAEGNILELQIVPNSLAAVTISLGLHEMPRELRQQVIKRAKSWLRPAGRLVICDYCLPDNRVWAGLFRWFGALIVEPEYFVDFLSDRLDRKLEALGLRAVTRERMFLSCLEVSAWEKPGSQRREVAP